MSGSPARTETRAGAYGTILLDIFGRLRKGRDDFVFDRGEIVESARRCNVERPKNLGDVVYAFRYRRPLPAPILDSAPPGRAWIILGAGDGRYRFRLSRLARIAPTEGLLVRKIPDATPEIVAQYALNDEQALLARIRYNRLVDLFLGIAACSIQSHLRTKIPGYGQIETDELYVGVDTRGAQYVVPVQAKGGGDSPGTIQTIQDTIFCRTHERYRNCAPRPVSAQFMPGNVIALFELDCDGDDVSIVCERQYRLVEAGEIDEKDLAKYRRAHPS